MDKKRENDIEEKFENLDFIVDKDLVDYFKGFQIDFVSGWISKRFLIEPISGATSKC